MFYSRQEGPPLEFFKKENEFLFRSLRDDAHGPIRKILDGAANTKRPRFAAGKISVHHELYPPRNNAFYFLDHLVETFPLAEKKPLARL